MKKTIPLFCLASLVTVFAGCNKENTDVASVEASVISTFEKTSFDLTDDSDNPYLFRMFWTPSKYFNADGTPVHVDGVVYEVEADLADNGFSSPQTVYQTDGLYMEVYNATLAGIRSKLVGDGDLGQTTVGLRIKSTGKGHTAYSDPVIITINPFIPQEDVEITKVEPSVFTGLSTDAYWLRYSGDRNPVAITVGWTAPKFYLNGSETPATEEIPVNYQLEIDAANNGFAGAKILANTTSLSAELLNNTLNAIMVEDFHAAPDNAYELELRLHITYGQGELAGETYSEKGSIFVIPFKPFDALQAMYIIGESINGWDMGDINTMYPMFKENSDASNFVYTYTGYMPETTFKFLPEQSLGTAWCFCPVEGSGTDVALTDVAAPFNNTAAGFKTITLDVKSMTWSITDYDASAATVWNSIGFIGTVTGWGSEIPLAKVSEENNHIWVNDNASWGKSTEGYHCGKFRANQSYNTMWEGVDGNDWATPYCRVFYNNGTNRNIYFAPDEATFRLVFNDLTGHYIVRKK